MKPWLPALAITFGLSLFPGCKPTPETPPITAADDSQCETAQRAITKAAIAEAACTKDADCRIRDVPMCSMPGLGCYFHVSHRSASPKPLDQAIAAYQQLHHCPMTECDCAAVPTVFSCVGRRCVVAADPPPARDAGQGVE
jgi:hypothetical protein